MGRITSKHQVTVPKALAERYKLQPGDDIDWAAAGELIHVIPRDRLAAGATRQSRLRLFDQATERHRRRPSVSMPRKPRGRGWTREDLYRRGRPS